MPDVKYTVVRHSAFVFKDDGQFEQGLETRTLHTIREQSKVTKAGGVLFDDYCAAEDFAEAAMYPPDVRGLIPQAKGTFSNAHIDGLPIYIPVRQVVG